MLRALHGTVLFEDLRGPQQQQEPDFQYEKAVNHGMDLMPCLRGGKKQFSVMLANDITPASTKSF
jgi:hypothetical protein